MVSKTYRPRKDYVLFRRVQMGKLNGLHMPDTALEGLQHVVVAVGPDVKDLEPGDVIIPIGRPNEDYGRVPGEADLYLTKEGFVCLIVEVKTKVVTA